jgi:hypothetical protein
MTNTNFSCKAGEGRAGEGGVGIKKLGLQPAQCRTVNNSVAMYAAKPVVFATHENFVRILTTAQEGRDLNKWRLHERPTVWMD